MAKNPHNKKSRGKVEARPVLESLREPEYPTAMETSSSKCRWGKAAAGAATFFLAINIGGVAESIPPMKYRPQMVQQAQEAMAANATFQSQNGIIVAPLFEHGEGRGAAGCVVVSPPVFLSEEEAMQIIKEELGKHGIKLDKGGELAGVEMRMPVPNIYGFSEDEGKTLENPISLNVDGENLDKGIAIEFVSRSDLDALKQKSDLDAFNKKDADGRWMPRTFSMRRSSVQSYDMKSVAKSLIKNVEGKGKRKVYLGVFYDPTGSVNAWGEPVDWKAFEKEAEKQKKDEKTEEKETLTEEQRHEEARKSLEKLARL
ncbi:MAG: hypothetical protein PVH19_14990, partial [Planctomycetia bacterium]